ncbi:unnamed protein product [Meganyctiphanes norvegica]|uniref:Uncharacterized protein n=1 Tax=Meganyctiphanes norvegica TaxID=48144 RepID=A0AAV2QXG6_MEGNR
MLQIELHYPANVIASTLQVPAVAALSQLTSMLSQVALIGQLLVLLGSPVEVVFYETPNQQSAGEFSTKEGAAGFHHVAHHPTSGGLRDHDAMLIRDYWEGSASPLVEGNASPLSEGNASSLVEGNASSLSREMHHPWLRAMHHPCPREMHHPWLRAMHHPCPREMHHPWLREMHHPCPREMHHPWLRAMHHPCRGKCITLG